MCEGKSVETVADDTTERETRPLTKTWTICVKPFASAKNISPTPMLVSDTRTVQLIKSFPSSLSGPSVDLLTVNFSIFEHNAMEIAHGSSPSF